MPLQCLSASGIKGNRLQTSLLESRRTNGKVGHEHIASLGSIELPQTVAGRIAFWAALYERLAKLSNRVTDPRKILGAIHAKIPMVTPDEQRALQLDNARSDARFWSNLRDMNQSTADDHKGLLTKTQGAIAASEAQAANAATNAEIAQKRVEQIERGENVGGGLGKPMSREDLIAILKEAGWTRSTFNRAELLASLTDAEMEELRKRMPVGDILDRATTRAARAILRERGE